MIERPILFSGPMVRAILEGRKTMTRRVIKGAPIFVTPFIGADNKPTNEYGLHFTHERVIDKHVRCPYGQPGDRLWVRETWGVGCRPDPREGWVDGIEYRADQAYIDEIEDLPLYPVELPDGVEIDDYVSKGWRPSIYMPRWASRITLEINAERVERLLDITDDDAIREGITEVAPGDRYPYGVLGAEKIPRGKTPRAAFLALWNSINGGAYPASENCWTWVLEIKKVD